MPAQTDQRFFIHEIRISPTSLCIDNFFRYPKLGAPRSDIFPLFFFACFDRLFRHDS
jgi:hypothetical protein